MFRFLKDHLPARFLVLATSVLAIILAASAFNAGTADPVGVLSNLNSTHERVSVSPMANNSENPIVYVRVFDKTGKLTNPVRQEMVVKTDAEWRAQLSDEEYRITRNHGTEPAFCGGLLDNKDRGYYTCVCCGLPLFESTTKFKSGTGWPSFFQPVASENIAERPDLSLGMARTEILCKRCDAHLGHVFPDGPEPTGLRYCLNSAALNFVPYEKVATIAEDVTEHELGELVLGGGCFWCVEAVFEQVDGVVDVVSGYAGGDAETANYKAVSAGRTRHAEAVRITYDPERAPLEALLKVHFATHDPTTLNRQGNDVGPQYRSAIFYANEEEKAIAQAFIQDMDEAGVFNNPIVTTLEPLDAFYEAEAYHQNYVCRNPMQPYVRAVALPKVDKLRKAMKTAGAADAE